MFAKCEHNIPDAHIRFRRTYDSFWDVLVNEPAQASTTKEDSSPEVPYRIPNDSIMISESRIAHSAVLFLALASGLFGAMHAIAWHFEFPSAVERILWQTATVVAAGSPVVGLVTIPLSQWIVSTGDPQLFAVKCLRLLREYSWHVKVHRLASYYDQDKHHIDTVYGRLEPITAGLEAPLHYSSIFSAEFRDVTTGPELVPSLLEFLNSTGEFSYLSTNQQTELHTDSEFVEHLRKLDRLMRGEGSKKLKETSRQTPSQTRTYFPRPSTWESST